MAPCRMAGTEYDLEESISQLRRLVPTDVPVVLSSAAWDDYRVPGSPYFVFVDGPSGAVTGEGSAAAWPPTSHPNAEVLSSAGSR